MKSYTSHRVFRSLAHLPAYVYVGAGLRSATVGTARSLCNTTVANFSWAKSTRCPSSGTFRDKQAEA